MKKHQISSPAVFNDRSILYSLLLIVSVVVTACTTEKFQPGVSLPEIDSGKPFTRWDGIVLTCTGDSKTLLDGRLLENETAVKQIEDAATAREKGFREISDKVKRELPRVKVSLIPLLLCIDKRCSVDDFFRLLDYACRAGCVNVYVAVKRSEDFGALSLCIPMSFDRNYNAFWREQLVAIKGNVTEIKAKLDEGGRYRFSSRFGAVSYIRPIIIESETVEIVKKMGGKGEGAKPSDTPKPQTYETIEPLFDMIEKFKAGEVVVLLDLCRFSKNLRWEWLAGILARLEKTDIKGYSFATPEESH